MNKSCGRHELYPTQEFKIVEDCEDISNLPSPFFRSPTYPLDNSRRICQQPCACSCFPVVYIYRARPDILGLAIVGGTTAASVS